MVNKFDRTVIDWICRLREKMPRKILWILTCINGLDSGAIGRRPGQVVIQFW